MTAPTTRECLNCGNPRGCGGSRGLCQGCYDAARRAGTLDRWQTNAERRAAEQAS
jgi:hypothetical protein